MLEGLEAIDWEQLEHAQGMAEDIPDLIWAILAGEVLMQGRLPLTTLHSTLCNREGSMRRPLMRFPFLLNWRNPPS